MKAVIFAGGVGTRLWPLSRKKSPKQFEKIIGNKSTLQLAVDRLIPEFAPHDIYISTGRNYVDVVHQQVNFIPKENIIGEPEKKDVGPAVSYVMTYLAEKYPKESVVILWSDHLVRQVDKFKRILQSADKLIQKDSDKIVFIGQKPRFASENLGWIESGAMVKKEEKIDFRSFLGFKYRPEKKRAERYFKDGHHCWNLGYFVSTPQFVNKLFEQWTPTIYELSQKIMENKGKKNFDTISASFYAKMPKINFDNAILEKLDKKSAYVVIEDIGWSDVGAWEALKEALEKQRDDNITKGKVLLEDSFDNLVYNYDDKKMIVGIDLEDILIVNTDDVLLVAKKTSVGKIKKLVENFQGTENEKLT
ncbi:MAG TPA: sugar phosphate nucleotidyltransferase [Patescibacteria group bacterium]|nr:sugar phosphate nucleotidyltransferase [Patescibacteria group bacterium]